MLRGGSGGNNAKYLRVTIRSSKSTNIRITYIGFWYSQSADRSSESMVSHPLVLFTTPTFVLPSVTVVWSTAVRVHATQTPEEEEPTN